MTEISGEPRQVEVATLGIRALAAIVDILIVVVLWSAYGLVLGKEPEFGYGFSVDGIPALLGLAVMFAYYIVSEAVWGGTPAKMLIGLRVVSEADGRAIDWGQSLIRNLLRAVDGLPALYLAGFFFAVSSPKTQRLGDRMARTVVIRI